MPPDPARARELASWDLAADPALLATGVPGSASVLLDELDHTLEALSPLDPAGQGTDHHDREEP